ELESVLQRPQRPRPVSGMYKAQVTPHWFDNNTRFWYRNDLRGGKREFILVDAEHGKREAAFDHQKLAASLSKASARANEGDNLPFDSIDFIDSGKAIRFHVGDTTWQCDLATYECTKSQSPEPIDLSSDPDANAEVARHNAELARQESLWPDDPARDPQ